MRKDIIVGLFLLIATGLQAQYNPSLHTVTNKAIGIAQDAPTDARSKYYSTSTFKYRLYKNTTEVLNYLALPKYRGGQFPIFINIGGVLQSDSVTFLGGQSVEYWFKNGLADSNLVVKVNVDSIWAAINTKPSFGDVRDEIGDSLQGFVRLQTQAPTSILTGGFSYERQPTGNYTVTLDWTAGRQAATPSAAATATLSTIVVDGISQTFSQPAAGASISGTKSVTFAKNTNITYANSVTTSDGKSAVSYTSFTVYDKRYIGWAASPTPTDIEILFAVNSDNNGGTVPYSATFPQLSGGALYLFYANTATVSSVSVNGFPSTDAFNLNVSRSFVNGVGGTTTYLVTTSKNAIGATSSTSLTIN